MIRYSTSDTSKSIATTAEMCHTNKDTVIKHAKMCKSLLIVKNGCPEDTVHELNFILDLIDLRDSGNLSY